MFKVIKLRPILIFVAIVLVSVLLSVGIVSVVKVEKSPRPVYTIVIDAGHGGRDNGCSGIGGTIESNVNLEIARALKTYLETLDIRVVMTRADANGLYSANADNYKQSDMEKRIEIIEECRPNMVISIHQNSFSDCSQRGAQVFYQEGDEVSQDFAQSVQSQILSQLPEARKECNYGDYYILKECGLPAVLVECGYLSNPDEEILLNTSEYQNKVAYAIMCGVVRYYGLCGNE